MKKRFLTLALALVLCVGLAVPALAADASEVQIIWLPEDVEGEPFFYDRDLHYVAFKDDNWNYTYTIQKQANESLSSITWSPFRKA